MIVVSDHRNLLSQLWSLILRYGLFVSLYRSYICISLPHSTGKLSSYRSGPMTIVGAIWVCYIETLKFCDPVTLVTLLLFESVTFL